MIASSFMKMAVNSILVADNHLTNKTNLGMKAAQNIKPHCQTEAALRIWSRTHTSKYTPPGFKTLTQAVEYTHESRAALSLQQTGTVK